MSALDRLRDAGIRLTGPSLGHHYTTCPQCSASRKPVNRKKPCMTVTIKPDGVVWLCHHCGWTGGASDETRRQTVRRVLSDPDLNDDTGERIRKARWLWQQRRHKVEGSPVEIYLRNCRGYSGPIPATIGYLPPSKPDHHPAMIAAFGIAEEPEPGVLAIADNKVMAVHMTLLLPDGSGKVRIDRAKIMMGAVSGSPIVLAPMNDSLGLAVTEGIEDALSIHAATRLGAWAAGSASHMAKLGDAVPDYTDSVTIVVDDDEAGHKGAEALAERLKDRGIHVEPLRLKAVRHAA